MKHFLRHFRNKETSHLQKWPLGQFIIPYRKQNKIHIFLFFSLLIFQSKICLGVHTYDPALILNIIPPYRKRGVLRHGKCCDPGWNSGQSQNMCIIYHTVYVCTEYTSLGSDPHSIALTPTPSIALPPTSSIALLSSLHRHSSPPPFYLSLWTPPPVLTPPPSTYLCDHPLPLF